MMAALREPATDLYRGINAIPVGEVITDMITKKWTIGPLIGSGGFGVIYSAANHPKTTNTYPFAIKMEPCRNPPLYVETVFFMEIARPEDIEAWMKKKKLASFGMPRYLGTGFHDFNRRTFRFLVMDRYGSDIWTLFVQNRQVFPCPTVYRIALQMIDVLEYIHTRGYVHADISGPNMVVGIQEGTENQVYLVDFGLATKYHTKEYKLNPRRAHAGTTHYSSRDAHMGVPTRRGDLEILGYNLLHWLSSHLPWEKFYADPVQVQVQKNYYMNDIPELMKCFRKQPAPSALVKYFNYVAEMEYDTKPDYDKCRDIFKVGLKDLGCTVEGKLVFQSARPNRRVADGTFSTEDGELVLDSARLNRRVVDTFFTGYCELVLENDSPNKKVAEDTSSAKAKEVKVPRQKLMPAIDEENGNNNDISKNGQHTGNLNMSADNQIVEDSTSPKKRTRKQKEKSNSKRVTRATMKASGIYKSGTYKRLERKRSILENKKPKHVIDEENENNNNGTSTHGEHTDNLSMSADKIAEDSPGPKKRTPEQKRRSNPKRVTRTTWQDCATLKASGVYKSAEYKRLEKKISLSENKRAPHVIGEENESNNATSINGEHTNNLSMSADKIAEGSQGPKKRTPEQKGRSNPKRVTRASSQDCATLKASGVYKSVKCKRLEKKMNLSENKRLTHVSGEDSTSPKKRTPEEKVKSNPKRVTRTSGRDCKWCK